MNCNNQLKPENLKEAIVKSGYTNYDFKEEDYKGRRKPLRFRCIIHDIDLHINIAKDIISKQNRCKECRLELLNKSKKKRVVKKVINLEHKEKIRKGRFKKFLDNKFIKEHTNYDFSNSNFQKLDDPIEFICSVHNKKLRSDKAVLLHSKTNVCEECRITKEFDNFIGKSISKYGSKFDYSDTQPFRDIKDIIKIKCIKHGVLNISAISHLYNRHGCNECALDHCINKGGWTKTDYVKKIPTNTSNVYVIKITGNNEFFYKIGLTYKSVNERFKKKDIPDEYHISIEYLFEDLDAGIAYDFEKLLHKHNKQYKYKTQLFFQGHTECFTQVPTDIQSYLDLLETIK